MGVFSVDVEQGAICIFHDAPTKFEALECLGTALAEQLRVSDHERFKQALFEREAVMSTGIGGGVAIPHVRITDLDRPAIGVGLCRAGIDYETLDSNPVRIIVMFAMPAASHREYLGLLAQVMLALREPGFCDRLVGCRTEAEVVAVLNESANADRAAVRMESA